MKVAFLEGVSVEKMDQNILVSGKRRPSSDDVRIILEPDRISHIAVENSDALLVTVHHEEMDIDSRAYYTWELGFSFQVQSELDSMLLDLAQVLQDYDTEFVFEDGNVTIAAPQVIDHVKYGK